MSKLQLKIYDSSLESIDLVYFENLPTLPVNRIVILDIDGTLVCDGESIGSDAVKRQVDRLRENNVVYLCSNSQRHDRTRQMAAVLQVKPLLSRHFKPSRKILSDIGCSGRECVVIGDKLLTDAWFARRVGADFILVRRKISGREIPYVKMLYWLDNMVAWICKSLKFKIQSP